jgi:hypothetical protein
MERAFDHEKLVSGAASLTRHAHRPAQHQEADGHDPTPSDADSYARPRDTHRGGLSGQERHHDKQRNRNTSSGNLTGRVRLWEFGAVKTTVKQSEQTHQPTISLHGAMPPERTWLICPTFSGNEWFTRYAPKGPEGLSPGVLTPGRNISQKASRPEGGVRLRVGKEFKCNAQRSYVSTVLRSFLWTGERLVETKSLNLTPLQGEVRLMRAFPGLKTLGLNPAAPSGRRALNTYRTLVKFHELASINCSLTDSF